jgi:hypothetical protein
MNKHQDNLARINRELVELAVNAIRDTKVGAGVKVSFNNLIKVGGGGSRKSSTAMNSNDKLELSKAILQNAQETRNSITDDPYYASLLKDLDNLINSYRQELSRIDEELKLADEENKKRLNVEKSEVLKRGVSTDTDIH